MDAITWDEAAVLRDHGLLPREIEDEFDTADEPEDIADRYRGALVGMGVGEALGRPLRGMPAEVIAKRIGELRGYLSEPQPRWLLPAGQLGSNTQLAILTADTLVTRGRIEPRPYADRLSAWLPVARGAGEATRQAVRALRNGTPWLQSGVNSAGAAAAVRAVPVGLAFPRDADALRHDAAINAVVTHRNGAAVASAVVTAAAVAHLTHLPRHGFDLSAFRAVIKQSLLGVVDPEVVLHGGSAVSRLSDRIDMAFDLTTSCPPDALKIIGTTGLVLEALPAALYAFAATPENPIRAILTAVQAGHDSDTVAALAGAFAGAYHGSERLPDPWVAHLEYADGLAGLADQLLELSGSGATPAPLRGGFDPLHPATYAPFRLGGVVVPTIEHAIRSSAVKDPSTAVKMRILPTPADARRYGSMVEYRGDWSTVAPNTIQALLRRRFTEGTSDLDRLRDRSDVDLELLAGVFEPDEPFDYPLLLAVRRDELATSMAI